MDILNYTVFSALFSLLQPGGAFPQPHSDTRGFRIGKHTSCIDLLEYRHDNICCLNCEAGEYVKSPCTDAGRKGTCEECHLGTFTEHANGLNQCFKCTQCRPDQKMERPCTPTQNTMCTCKPGRFCHPDEACEVCKKCSRCKSDEEEVRNCTSTTDTVCKKIQPESESVSDTTAMTTGIIFLCVLVVFCAGGIICYMWKKRRGTTDPGSSPADGLKARSDYTEVSRTDGTNLTLTQQLMHLKHSADSEDEHKMLCESCNSLTGLHCSAPPTSSSCVSSRVLTLPNKRDDEPLPTLIPVNGVESLRSCFDFFVELDMDYHKRFFRGLGLNENVIKSKEHLLYEDKVNELLNIWVEKEGRDATLNDLLKVLLELNQRRTAEVVMERVVQCGYYCCEC